MGGQGFYENDKLKMIQAKKHCPGKYMVITLSLPTYVTIMLNKNTLGVKKVRGQSEAALQTGVTKNFDISRGQAVTYQNSF